MCEGREEGKRNIDALFSSPWSHIYASALESQSTSLVEIQQALMVLVCEREREVLRVHERYGF